jgi:hypothetical protein
MGREVSLVQAFNHPLRRAIWRQVHSAPLSGVSPKELSDDLQTQLKIVSYHVRVLAQAKALVCVRTVPVRGSLQHFYLVNNAVADLEWVHALTQEGVPMSALTREEEANER